MHHPGHPDNGGQPRSKALLPFAFIRHQIPPGLEVLCRLPQVEQQRAQHHGQRRPELLPGGERGRVALQGEAVAAVGPGLVVQVQEGGVGLHVPVLGEEEGVGDEVKEEEEQGHHQDQEHL